MRRCLRAIVIVFSACALLACSSLKTLSDSREASAGVLNPLTSPLTSRDAVVLTLLDGRRIEMVVLATEPDTLVGQVAGASEPLRVPHAQVARVERVEIDTARSLGVVALVVLALVAIGQAAARSFGASLGSVAK
jgi:hypothetical protein